VLCDVPCSGLGILRRKPEIRYKEPADIDKLPELQYFILCNASSYVKKGGLLVYSTCTLNPSENEDVCNRFLKEHPKFKSLPVFPDFPNRYKSSDFLTLMPHRHKSDGFFIALFTGTE
jgi:16S rRNA (cytosine967-C5)-methyltransferase